MSKFIARLVVGLAVLYAVGAIAFAFFDYAPGQRPAVPKVLSDFNAWLLTPFRTVPGTPPAPAPPPAPPAPPAAQPTPPPAEPAAEDPIDKELRRIERDVLPRAQEAGRKLRDMSRADNEAFESLRTDAMASLGEARTFLNTVLEKDPHHKRANSVWNRLQELYRALKSL